MMHAKSWQIRGMRLDMSYPRIMGIVNVTPDSFSDGGLHASRTQAIAWGEKLRDDGADILDVGGESTRPGAAEVSVSEELDRVVPVVEALVKAGCIVSVDTSKPQVMIETLKAGAHILNDVMAFQNPGAIEVAGSSQAGLVVMHMRGTPRTMQSNLHYDNLIEEVKHFFVEREAALVRAGARRDQICWDPGFGFGKSVEDNFKLLAATGQFVRCGRVFLMGLSRKSSIGAVTGVKAAADRVSGSVAGHLLAICEGAQIVRVHDVREMAQAIAVWRATVAAKETLR